MAGTSIHNERDRSFATQCLGVWTGLVSFLHDALGLIGSDVRELGMKLDGKAVTALVILDQTHHRTHGGLLDRSSELLGRIDEGTVVTSGIGTGK